MNGTNQIIVFMINTNKPKSHGLDIVPNICSILRK